MTIDNFLSGFAPKRLTARPSSCGTSRRPDRETERARRPPGDAGRERGWHHAGAGGGCKCDRRCVEGVRHRAHRATGHPGAHLERNPDLAQPQVTTPELTLGQSWVERSQGAGVGR
jgi:hypothetical protein